MANGVIVLGIPVPVVHIADRPTLSLSLPIPVLSLTGGGVGEKLVLPVLKLLLTGNAPITPISIVLPAPVVSISATTPTSVGDILLRLPSATFDMAGVNSRAEISLVLPSLVFHTIRPYHGLIDMDLPTPVFYGYGTITPTSVSYQGIVMNLARQAITTYSGFPMNSMAFYNGSYIGATSTGIYTLGGDLDKTSIISANLKTGTLDFGSGYIKHIRDIWLTYRSDGDLAIVLEADEDTDNPVELRTQISDSKMHEERLGHGTGGVPRGFNGRFYTIELKNIDGSSLDLNSISILVDAIRRKLR